MSVYVCRDFWLSVFLSFFLSFFFIFYHVDPADGAETSGEEVLVLLRNSTGAHLSAASFSEGAGTKMAVHAAQTAGAEVLRVYPALSRAVDEIFVLMRSEGKSAEALAEKLRNDPEVLAASPNFRFFESAAEGPDDPLYRDGSLWGLNAIRADLAWELATGDDDIHIAVLDTGLDADHEDLSANVDLDHSANFTNGDDPTPRFDRNFIDARGHGTHVAGTIGAVGNNGTGVTGVNWKVKIIALKVLGDDGQGWLSWLIAALDHLAALQQSTEKPLRVYAVNMSLNGWYAATPESKENRPFLRALQALDASGKTLLVVGAGNEGLEVGVPSRHRVENSSGNVIVNVGDWNYPASFNGLLNNMIVVGAVDRNLRAADAERWSTNWSDTHVDLLAPGVEVLSTVPPRAVFSHVFPGIGHKYLRLSGTSMAAPHVAGAVGLLAARFPQLSAPEMKARLLGNADDGVNPRNGPKYHHDKIKISAAGLLDVKAALDDQRPSVSARKENSGGDGGGGCNAWAPGSILLPVILLWRKPRSAA